MVIQLEDRLFSNREMKIEVDSAADFLMNLLRVRQKMAITDTQLRNFRGTMADVLMERYQRHWYPEFPAKGSGYRCIRINGQIDPLVEQAGVAAGLNLRTLRKMLPHELTMWIDPAEVCYRIGENGSVCVLYDSSRASPSSDLDSKGSDGSEENLADPIGRIDIASDLKDFMLNLYEADTTIITRPRSHRNRHHHIRSNNPNHHKHQNYHPSSTSNVQVSPCSSPAYLLQQQQQKLLQQQRAAAAAATAAALSNQTTPSKYDLHQFWDTTSVRSPC